MDLFKGPKYRSIGLTMGPCPPLSYTPVRILGWPHQVEERLIAPLRSSVPEAETRLRVS